MRRLKLQTADGFVAGPEGQLDWMTWNMDEKLQQLITQLTDTADTILLGRKMTPGFVNYWEHEITKPEGPQYSFAQKMVELPKVVFSRTLNSLDGRNVRVENGDLKAAVNQLTSGTKVELLFGPVSGLLSALLHPQA